MGIDCTLVIGPTAVGKSGFVYKNFGDAPLHIISADSMQIYRNFDVATATPSGDQLNLFPHTGINEIDPDESYSVTEFLERADSALDEAVQAGRHPVILGGTPLYLRTFLYGMDDMPDENPDFRAKMRQLAEDTSSNHLHEKLGDIDPTAAEKIHPNDTKRIIRALEIYHETGQTKTELTSEDTIRNRIEPTVIGLTRARDELDDRIRDRIETMLNDGLIEEVKQLREQWNVSETLKQAIGYRSVSKYLDGKINKETIVERMYKRTHTFMRKQESWMNRFPVREWFHPNKDFKELMDTVGNKFY
jgi:tRNA dimethylallyltransferase